MVVVDASLYTLTSAAIPPYHRRGRYHVARDNPNSRGDDSSIDELAYVDGD